MISHGRLSACTGLMMLALAIMLMTGTPFASPPGGGGGEGAVSPETVPAAGGGDRAGTRADTYSVELGPAEGQPVTRTVDPGRTGSFTLVVSNGGNVRDDYNISWKGLPDGWSLAVEGAQERDDGTYLVTLDPQTSTQVRIRVTTSSDRDKGQTARVNVTAGSQGSPGTADSLELTVKSPYEPSFDFDVLLDTADPGADELVLLPGEKAVGYVDVYNTGNVDDRLTLSLVPGEPVREGGPSRSGEPGDRSGSGEWEVYFPDGSGTDTVALGAAGYGEDFDRLTFVMEAPATVSPGGETVEVTLGVTSAAGAASMEDSFTLEARDHPSYVLLETKAQALGVEPGETGELSVTAKNIGHQTVTYHAPEGESLASQLNAGGTTGWTCQVVPVSGFDPANGAAVLEAGGEAKFDLVLGTPLAAAADELHLLTVSGTVSEGGGIIELELTVLVELVHDLEYSYDDSPQTLRPGEPGELTVTLTNLGNGNDTVSLEVESAPSFWAASVSDGLITLSPSDSQYVSLSWTVPEDSPLGTFRLSVGMRHTVDGTSCACGNVTLEVRVEDFPDPALAQDGSGISLPEGLLPTGVEVQLNATVLNLGRLDAENVTVTFAYETRKHSVVDIGDVVLPMVRGGGSAEVSIMWEPAPSAARIMVTLDSAGRMSELDETNNQANRSVAVLPPGMGMLEESDEGPTGAFSLSSGESGALVVITFIVAAILAVILNGLFTEAGRYGTMSAFLPLYSKLKPERILDNDIRAQVFDYVRSNPGDHFRSIMHNLSLTNGTLAYHLATLEKQEMIKSERDGGYKRFYPRGQAFTGDIIEINGLQKDILDVISDNPGISQKKIATVLGTSTPTVSYHIKALKAARLIDVRRDGKVTRCFISTAAA